MHDILGRRSIGRCAICGDHIYAGNAEYDGDEYVEIDGEMIHAEDCIDNWVIINKKAVSYVLGGDHEEI